MGYIERTDHDQVQSQVADGGWDVFYGDTIDFWDVALGALSTVIPGGVGVAAWAEWQINAQLIKFGQNLDQISGDLLNLVIGILESIVSDHNIGEWDIGGLGVKAGVATYHYQWKIPPFGGFNDLPNKYQPYIAFRLAGPISKDASIQLQNTVPPVPISKTFPMPSPSWD